jgi:DNA-binding SARP family transcriptional activator
VTDGLDLRLLGPLTVSCNGQAVPLRRAKERALLAALLLNVGRPVSSGTLIEALWGDEPPPSAPASLQTHMMRLRRSLGDGVRARINTHPAGYEFTIRPGELDVLRVEALLRSARAAARERLWLEAAEDSTTALAEWRGEPLADVASELLARQELPRLTEWRLQLWELQAESALNLDRAADLITDLQRLASVHPLREHLRAIYMTALYRTGRQADAIASYQNIRQALVEQLGMEPGPELTELHQRILRQSA